MTVASVPAREPDEGIRGLDTMDQMEFGSPHGWQDAHVQATDRMSFATEPSGARKRAEDQPRRGRGRPAHVRLRAPLEKRKGTSQSGEPQGRQDPARTAGTRRQGPR